MNLFNKINKTKNKISIAIATSIMLVLNALSPTAQALMMNSSDLSKDIYFKDKVTNIKFYVSEIKDANNQLVFCMNSTKNPPSVDDLIEKGKLDDVVYRILANGYPNASFTGDNKKDLIITQTALWAYVDTANVDINNLVAIENNVENAEMLQHLKNLYNSAITGTQKPNVSIKFSDTNIVANLNGNNYETPFFQINSTGSAVKNSKLRLSTNTPGVVFKNEQGEVVKEVSLFTKIRAIIPSNTDSQNITINAKGTADIIQAVWYQPDDTNTRNIQNIAKLQAYPEIVEGNINVSWQAEGGVKIIKKDKETRQLLKGAEFQLIDTEGIVSDKGSILETLITDNNGEALSRSLPVGKYGIKEIKAPLGYEIENSNIQYINIDNASGITVEVFNAPIKGKVEINKFDLETLAPLKDAEFIIKNEEQVIVDTITTDTNGKATTKELPIGTYFITESRAPVGYAKPSENNTIDIDITESTVYTVDVKNEKIKGFIQIKKVDSENKNVPVNGAVFGIYEKETNTKVDELTTNIQGLATSKELPFGPYIIRELKAPDGYWQSTEDYPVSIEEHQKVYTREISNKPIQAKVKVEKVDKDTKLSLSGVKFSILDKHTNKVVSFTDGDTTKTIFTTDANGEFITPQPLRAGKYSLVEEEALPGYNKINPIDFNIDKNTAFEDIDGIGTVINLNVENEKSNGNFEIIKIDKDTKKPIAGVEFEITENTSTRVVNKTIYTTDENGKIKLNLNVGKYNVREVKAAPGYILKNETIEVTIKQGNNEALTIENEKITSSVQLQKIDKLEPTKRLEGATFALYNEAGLIKEYTTDAKGEINIASLPYGKYYMIETKAPNGYILDNTTKHEFEINNPDSRTILLAQNIKAEGEVDFSKTDLVTGDIIEGAKIEIIGLDEHNKDIKHEFISSKEGNRFTLPIGKYQFKETIAPEGYVLSEEVGTFEIKAAGEVVKAELKNKPIVGHIEIIKVDAQNKKKVLEGAEFALYDATGKELAKAITGKDGKITFKNLKYGNYSIKELKAPQGYELKDKIFEAKIIEDGKTITFEVDNQARLVQTGGGISNSVLIGVGSLLVVGGLYIVLKKKKPNQDSEE